MSEYDVHISDPPIQVEDQVQVYCSLCFPFSSESSFWAGGVACASVPSLGNRSRTLTWSSDAAEPRGDILLATWAVKGVLYSLQTDFILWKATGGLGTSAGSAGTGLISFPTPVPLWLCMTIAKSLNLSEPQFLYLEMWVVATWQSY